VPYIAANSISLAGCSSIVTIVVVVVVVVDDVAVVVVVVVMVVVVNVIMRMIVVVVVVVVVHLGKQRCRISLPGRVYWQVSHADIIDLSHNLRIRILLILEITVLKLHVCCTNFKLPKALNVKIAQYASDIFVFFTLLISPLSLTH